MMTEDEARQVAQSLCPLRGTAKMKVHADGSVEWLHADDDIHVPVEQVADEQARKRLETRYTIEETCPADLRFRHARLRRYEASNAEPS